MSYLESLSLDLNSVSNMQVFALGTVHGVVLNLLKNGSHLGCCKSMQDLVFSSLVLGLVNGLVLLGLWKLYMATIGTYQPTSLLHFGYIWCLLSTSYYFTIYLVDLVYTMHTPGQCVNMIIPIIATNLDTKQETQLMDPENVSNY